MASQSSSNLVFLQYLTTAFDNIRDAILLIGIERHAFRLLTANAVFFKISGFPASSAGKLVSDFVDAASYAFLEKKCQRVIKTKKTIEYTRWGTVPTGRKAFEVRLIPIMNTVGECVQIVAVTRDVSELLGLREQVKRLSKLAGV